MGANKHEAFEMVVIHRSQIKGADYNPRKITPQAEKRLRAWLKAHGLWGPLIWNVATGTLISGHRRLKILDTLMRTDDYQLTVAQMDVDELEEVKGNVFMNNTSAQGEWDLDILASLGETFPELDFGKDLGFSPEELSLLVAEPEIEFDESDLPTEFERDALLPVPTKAGEELTEERKEEFREAKKKQRETAKLDNADGRGYSYVDSDYALSVIFSSAEKKGEFLRILDLDPSAKRILADELLKVLL